MSEPNPGPVDAAAAIKAQLKDLSSEEQKSILQRVSEELKLNTTESSSGSPKETAFYAPPTTVVANITPDRRVVNYIWTAIITGFLIVFVGSAAGLVVALFMFHGTDPITKLPMDNTGIIQPLITLFTAAVGFLAGVLTPSPVHSNQAPTNQGSPKQGQ